MRFFAHRLHRWTQIFSQTDFFRIAQIFAFLAKAHPDGLKSRHDSNL